MGYITKLGALALGIFASAGIALAETPVLRLSALEGGTVNWELDTIKHNGFDTANGFDLQVQAAAGTPASQIAFQAGEADAIVSDWLWVARQRAEGHDYVFIPYSKAVGALLVPKDSTATKLSDLAGGKIGIAGGPVDKSWLILRAYAQKAEGFDLAAGTEQVFGAPPLIFKSALDGELAGAVNFWHFNAKMEVAGMRPLVTVTDAAVALGLDPETPLLGYVVKGEMVREHPELIQGLAAASRAAKDLLATDEAAWDRLRESMNVKTDEQFAALKAGYRAGIPGSAPVDEGAAGRMLALMAELGGKELVGDVKVLPDGVFLQPGS
ncbi:MAG: ABC transporter substrate-binding protein [Rhodobacteraceae bacterium]|nr:ABC transporter substrate-binding protein [Paracoccaceae bacterium]